MHCKVQHWLCLLGLIVSCGQCGHGGQVAQDVLGNRVGGVSSSLGQVQASGSLRCLGDVWVFRGLNCTLDNVACAVQDVSLLAKLFDVAFGFVGWSARAFECRALSCGPALGSIMAGITVKPDVHVSGLSFGGVQGLAGVFGALAAFAAAAAGGG